MSDKQKPSVDTVKESVFTSSCRCVVFHWSSRKEEAPDLHLNGEWFFEPVEYCSNELFSKGYLTRESALLGAEMWELNN